ncbi:N-acetylmuramoyl-L-alanine amidase [Isoptericola haloaureus]|uniref:N-acetylmuramoyl-L-alanine amidase n=1 Tax=Isoptericola haloaureus TaxID=1542902 RepID=A0ABU7Z5H4_9MICO
MTPATRAGRRTAVTVLVGLLSFSLVAVPGAQAVPASPGAVAADSSDDAGAPGAAHDRSAEPVEATTETTGFSPAAPAAGGSPASPRAQDAPRARDSAGPPDRPEHAGVPLEATSDVTGFGVVGVTWSSPVAHDALVVEVRTSDDAGAAPDDDGAWSAWERVDVEPSPRGDLDGTEPVVVGEVARVQARVSGPSAGAVRDLGLTVIDPGTSPADDDVPVPSEETSPSGRAVAAAPVPDRPTIASRAAWGADESIMTWTPRQGDVGGAAIHHTAGTNSYSESQVPGILRGIYSYHAQTRGWGDIGYNFLVDKFGRIWEGRAGGVTRETVGAHARGYNSGSTGVSVLGNYETATVSNAAVSAVVRLVAWKLALHGVAADDSISIAGTPLAAVFGHRDVGSTACPGRTLYDRLGEIRRRARALQDVAARPDLKDGTFVARPDGTVAMVERGRKHVAWCGVVRAFGGRCADAVAVSWREWNALEPGKRLRKTVETHDGRVFRLVDGKKKETFDEAALAESGLGTKRTRLHASAVEDVPYGWPIVRPGVVVVNRATGNHRLVVTGSRHGYVNRWLHENSMVGQLDHGGLDRGSVRRMPGAARTTGVVQRRNGRSFVLTQRGLLRIDRTGDLHGSATTQHWGYALMQSVPRLRGAPELVALRKKGSGQIYVLEDGLRRPVSKQRLTELNGGQKPRVHVILGVTQRQFPIGPSL